MTGEKPLSFLLLGPLEVRVDGRPAVPGGLRQRALLALLLLRPNEVVARDRLIDQLWGGRPPERAANALAALVARLRRVLPAGVLATKSGGYTAQVEFDDIDLFRFERFRQEGNAALAGDPALAATLFRSALALWRGPPLDEFRYEPFAESAILRLEELRLSALEGRIEADAALGRSAELVSELQSLALEHPLRERFRAQLMEALYASGRQAEALEVYRQTQRLLSHELGLDPSPALQKLHQAILRQDETMRLAGQAVIEPPAPPRRVSRTKSERKIVTVVCLDLVGFMARAEKLDPEELEAFLAQFRTAVLEQFGRHGGRAEQFAGDAVMAVFGAPAAHKDDPERAVRAALAIRDWAADQDELAVRGGVMTGEALVRLDARPERGEDMVTGLVKGTAVRLQRAARHRSVLVGEPTFRATDQVVVYRPHEPLPPAGEGQPIEVWEAVDARARRA
jgi:DNA-binding SARP family transcriptional activator